jgi:alkylmercury lyase
VSERALGAAVGVGELAQAIGAARPSLDAAEERAALALYRLLADGEPVAVAALANRLDRPRAQVERTLERWPGLFRDDRQRVVGFHGLALGETAHRFRIEGRDLYAWCAWDTLFLPELLDQVAHVESRCASTGEPVRLTVSPTSAESVVPAETMVSMLVPKTAFDDDVILSFCHYVHFFSSEQAAEPWLERHPDSFLLSVEQAFELGRLANRINFPTLLA